MTMNDDFDIELDREEKKPVAIGLHTVVLEDVERRKSSNGNPMFLLRLRVIGDNDPDRGEALWTNLVLVDSARWKIDEFLDAIAVPRHGKGNMTKYLGRKLKVKVSHRYYNEQPRPQVDNFLPLPGARTGGGEEWAQDELPEEHVDTSSFGAGNDEIPF